MKYCGYCLNHGFRFYNWKDHIDNCPLRRCVCSKCREVAAEEGVQMDSNIASTSTQNMMDSGVTQASGSGDQINGHFELSSDPMEDVRSLAQELSKSDISEKDLQTCVLYALLESNHFSITETRKQLRHSRNAIAESLILPTFNINRELNLKRAPSPQKESNETQNETKKSTEKLIPLNKKAKKSFPRKRKTDANLCWTDTYIKDISVETNGKQSEDLRNGVISDFPTIPPIIIRKDREKKTSSVLNTSANCLAKGTNSPKNESTVIKPFERSTISSNTVTESVAQQINKKPIQSVRPLSNSSAVSTKSVSVNSSAIVSSLVSPQASISSKASLVDTTPNMAISSTNFYSDSQTKKAVTPQTPQPNVLKSVPTSSNSLIKRSKNSRSAENDLSGVVSNRCLGPKIKTYSKFNLKVRANGLVVEPNLKPIVKPIVGPNVEPNDEMNVENSVEQSLKSDIDFNFEADIEPLPPIQIQLCAKIITPEAALAALSAIPLITPSAHSSSESPDNTSADLQSTDSDQMIEVIKDEFTPKKGSEYFKPLETSYSNQFKLFLTNLKTTALSPPKATTNGDNNSTNAKEIIEITID